MSLEILRSRRVDDKHGRINPRTGAGYLYLMMTRATAICLILGAVTASCYGSRALTSDASVEPPPDGDITMKDAKELAAGRMTLGGNIETRVLCNETEDVIETAVRAAFEGPKDRFVLVTTAGCSPTLAEREYRNYMRLIDVWEELSPI